MNLVSIRVRTLIVKKHIMIHPTMTTYPPWSSVVILPCGGERAYIVGKGAAEELAAAMLS